MTDDKLSEIVEELQTGEGRSIPDVRIGPWRFVRVDLVGFTTGGARKRIEIEFDDAQREDRRCSRKR